MLERYNIGDEIEVFIYFDSEDRIIATTKKAYNYGWGICIS